MDVTLDGETLSAKETAALLAGTDSQGNRVKKPTA
jgi:hypothetical protein